MRDMHTIASDLFRHEWKLAIGGTLFFTAFHLLFCGLFSFEVRRRLVDMVELVSLARGNDRDQTDPSTKDHPEKTG
jgi:hypothetical protein